MYYRGFSVRNGGKYDDKIYVLKIWRCYQLVSELLSALSASASENLAAVLCSHSLTETMFHLSVAFLGLISSFHCGSTSFLKFLLKRDVLQGVVEVKQYGVRRFCFITRHSLTEQAITCRKPLYIKSSRFVNVFCAFL